ncbi:hypothetical protein SAMN04244579_03504 [Azotobacter beijerinckii]|uniref:Transposase n=1 Tax=Azotobacter beijerinckii TaxID=170623 RepID=A0A1H6X961_9GAMM|nr:hypothetical protein SAMN04244579_03504 [Azotobacter beijerinckii]
MKTSNRYSPEIKERAVRLVLEHCSQWQGELKPECVAFWSIFH